MATFGARKPSIFKRFHQTIKKIWAAIPREIIRTWLMMAGGTCLIVVLINQQTLPAMSTHTKLMDTANIPLETIEADSPFLTKDLAETEKKVNEALDKVPVTYRVDSAKVAESLAQYDKYVAKLKSTALDVESAIRDALMDSTLADTSEFVVSTALNTFTASLAGTPPFEELADGSVLAPWLTPVDACVPERIFIDNGRRNDDPKPTRVRELAPPRQTPFAFVQFDALNEAARQALSLTLDEGVMTAPPPTGKTGTARGAVVLRDQSQSAKARTSSYLPEDVPLPPSARQSLRERLRMSLQTLIPKTPATEPTSTSMFEEAAFALTSLALGETLVLDAITTESNQEQERQKAGDVMKLVMKDQLIQARGVPWTKQSISDYETYMSQKTNLRYNSRTFLAKLGANTVLAIFTMLFLRICLIQLQPARSQGSLRELALCITIIGGVLVAGKILQHMDPVGFVIPSASGAILLAILLDTRRAFAVSLLIAVLMSIQCGYDWRLLLVSAAMGCAGILGIAKVRRRSDITRAALNASWVGAVTAASVLLATDTLTDDAMDRILTGAGKAALGGFLSMFIVPGVLPSLERFFGIVTDVQLLEYSDLNNEILSKMSIDAPATFAHSLALGQLAEAAAEAIGANGLLARVCAYYHDIGKLKRPEYFSENQQKGNVHDRLSPRLSAIAIAAHVREGAQLARDLHLPKPVIDAIYEHHGTCRISFFYEQAKTQQKHGEVSEEDFRYPGPRPRSRETAILMICDAAESAARSMKNPNEERIRELIDKIIISRSEYHQFDDCDLTLKDLDTIEEVVTRRLLTMMHRRIAYPDQKGTGDPLPRIQVVRAPVEATA